MTEAVFDKAYGFTLGAEGGYSNVAGDKGGETIYGIARNANPEWAGWTLVDSYKHENGMDVKGLVTDQILKSAAKVFYKQKYWSAVNGDAYQADVACVLFDCAVNHGVTRANKILQEAAGVTVDGVIGPITMSQVNLYNGKALAGLMLNVRTRLYKNIVVANPTQTKFLKGWLNRVANLKRFLNIA